MPTPETYEVGGLTFVAIDEDVRTYYCANGGTIKIEHPKWLHVKRKENGDSHRLIDADGNSWYIPAGWQGISFKAPKGKEFAF